MLRCGLLGLVLIAVASSFSSCAGDGDVDSNNKALVADAAGRCRVDYKASPQQRCTNVLPDEYTGWDGPTKAKFLVSNIHGGFDGVVARPVNRRGQANCKPGMSTVLTPKAAHASRDMEEAAGWVDGTKVVLAEIQARKGSDACPDYLYNIGSPDYHQNARIFLILTVKKSGADLGQWEMVVVDYLQNDPVLLVVSRGRLKNCLELHSKGPNHSYAGFVPDCKPKHQLDSVAFASGVSMDSIIAAQSAISTDDTLNTAVTSLQSSLRDLLMTTLDPGKDPLWVTCSLGCCMADDPVIVDPPERVALERATNSKLALSSRSKSVVRQFSSTP